MLRFVVAYARPVVITAVPKVLYFFEEFRPTLKTGHNNISFFACSGQ
jgi:hypothetical protein